MRPFRFLAGAASLVPVLAACAGGSVAAGTQGEPPPEASLAVAVLPYTGMPEARGSWRRLLWIDFGDPGNRAPGSVGAHPEAPVAGSAWVGGMVRTGRDPGSRDPYLGDFAVGADAVFRIAADPEESLLVVVTVGLADSVEGALELGVGSEPMAAGLRPRPGDFLDMAFPVQAGAEDVAIRVRAEGCALFAVPGIAIYVDGKDALHPCRWGVRRGWGPAPADPSIPADLAAWTAPEAGAEAAVPVLSALCDHLMAHRLSEGCFASSGSWYETSFPVRALLAGARVLHRPELEEAALGCVDRFVAEEREGGEWSAATFGRAGCGHDRFLMAAIPSANLADVGSMMLALVTAARSAGPDRRDRYEAAARNHADHAALPHQMDSGAFPNRLFMGKDYRHPYSVATAVQASALAGLYAVTGEERYRRAAERAALFLAENVEPSGRFRFFRHDEARPAILPATALGETYYVIEGLLATLPWAGPKARPVIESALRHAFEGDEGLFTAMARPDWWLTAELWGASKQAGILLLVDQYHHRGLGGDRAAAWRDRALALLGASAPPFGVGEDPGGPRGRLASVATGFAALGAASVVDPDLVFPAPRGSEP